MRITIRMLRYHGACSMAIEEFRELFGESAEVNRKNAYKVILSDWLTASWVGRNILRGDARVEFYRQETLIRENNWDVLLKIIKKYKL